MTVSSPETFGPGGVISSTGTVFGVDSTPAAVLAEWYGNGQDGNETLPVGTTTLTENKFYKNLTFQVGSILDLNGFGIFVQQTLDLRAAGANAIVSSQPAGSNAGANGVGATGGVGSTFLSFGFINMTGGAGANGGTGVGPVGTAAVVSYTDVFYAAGGQGAQSGAGGGGTPNSGGAPVPPSVAVFPIKWGFLKPDLAIGSQSWGILGGIAGGGGSAGGGDGANPGGGGGGGGGGGQDVVIYANTIITGPSTPRRLRSRSKTAGLGLQLSSCCQRGSRRSSKSSGTGRIGSPKVSTPSDV